jgi:tellurium resistance protein TerD
VGLTRRNQVSGSRRTALTGPQSVVEHVKLTETPVIRPDLGEGAFVASINKGISKVEVALRWDPSPMGSPASDLDIIAATYSADDPYGKPAYHVHFDSRSPDGTITLNRDSHTGQGFGYDEVMTLELDRLAPLYVRVVVGVTIQQGAGRRTFGQIAKPGYRVRENDTDLAKDDFAAVSGSISAIVAEFRRDGSGSWEFIKELRGFRTDPASFAETMGNRY